MVYSTGDIIDTYTYRMGMENGRYSLATAVGMFKSVDHPDYYGHLLSPGKKNTAITESFKGGSGK